MGRLRSETLSARAARPSSLADRQSAFKLVPAEHRDEFTTRWYEIEMYLNSVGIGYHDAHAPVFRTRNFALVHAERPLIPPA